MHHTLKLGFIKTPPLNKFGSSIIGAKILKESLWWEVMMKERP